MRFRVFVVLMVATFGSLLSCASPSEPGAHRIASLQITPQQLTLHSLGESTQLQAAAYDATGGSMAAPGLVWSSSNPSVVSVDGSGRVTAEAEGQATVQALAVADSATASAAITVRQVPKSVSVTPGVDTVTAPGDTVAFRASATDSLGKPIVGHVLSWSSSDTAVATVNETGTATVHGAGSTMVTAAMDGVAGHASLVADLRGAARIAVSTLGTATDSDGYTLLVGVDSVHVSANDTALVSNLPSGLTPVSLVGLAAHCVAEPGESTIQVPVDDTVSTVLYARCIGRYAYEALTGSGGVQYELRYMDDVGRSHGLAGPGVIPGSPRWSPDGTQLAFAMDVAGNTDIYTVHPDGTSLTRLTNHPDSDYAPAWSPDGTRIAYFSAANDTSASLYVLDVNGQSSAEIVALPAAASQTGPAWSPDGSLIAYGAAAKSHGAVQIWTVAPDGSSRTPVTPATTDGTPAWARDPLWSPDGTRIAYLSAIPYGGWALMVTNLAGTDTMTVAQSSQGAMEPAWSPSGAQFAYMKAAGSTYEIFRINADGTNDTALIPSAGSGEFDPAWTPAGRSILFTDLSGSLTDVSVVNADGSFPQMLTPKDGARNPRPRPGS